MRDVARNSPCADGTTVLQLVSKEEAKRQKKIAKRICQLCQQKGDGVLGQGHLRGPFPGGSGKPCFLHNCCAVWTPTVCESTHGELMHLDKALKAAAKHVCHVCGQVRDPASDDAFIVWLGPLVPATVSLPLCTVRPADSAASNQQPGASIPCSASILCSGKPKVRMKVKPTASNTLPVRVGDKARPRYTLTPAVFCYLPCSATRFFTTPASASARSHWWNSCVPSATNTLPCSKSPESVRGTTRRR